jgi:hypothetical protein
VTIIRAAAEHLQFGKWLDVAGLGYDIPFVDFGTVPRKLWRLECSPYNCWGFRHDDIASRLEKAAGDVNPDGSLFGTRSAEVGKRTVQYVNKEKQYSAVHCSCEARRNSKAAYKEKIVTNGWLPLNFGEERQSS